MHQRDSALPFVTPIKAYKTNTYYSPKKHNFQKLSNIYTLILFYKDHEMCPKSDATNNKINILLELHPDIVEIKSAKQLKAHHPYQLEPGNTFMNHPVGVPLDAQSQKFASLQNHGKVRLAKESTYTITHEELGTFISFSKPPVIPARCLRADGTIVGYINILDEALILTQKPNASADNVRVDYRHTMDKLPEPLHTPALFNYDPRWNEIVCDIYDEIPKTISEKIPAPLKKILIDEDADNELVSSAWAYYQLTNTISRKTITELTHSALERKKIILIHHLENPLQKQQAVNLLKLESYLSKRIHLMEKEFFKGPKTAQKIGFFKAHLKTAKLYAERLSMNQPITVHDIETLYSNITKTASIQRGFFANTNSSKALHTLRNEMKSISTASDDDIEMTDHWGGHGIQSS